jgi:hypothetical protein
VIVNKLVIYAEVDGKICLIRNNVPVDLILGIIAGYEENEVIKVVPLKHVKLEQITEDDILKN